MAAMVSPRVATKPSRRIVEALTTSPTNSRSNGTDTYICTLISWRPCACRCIGVTLRRFGSEARPRASSRQPVRALNLLAPSEDLHEAARTEGLSLEVQLAAGRSARLEDRRCRC